MTRQRKLQLWVDGVSIASVIVMLIAYMFFFAGCAHIEKQLLSPEASDCINDGDQVQCATEGLEVKYEKINNRSPAGTL